MIFIVLFFLIAASYANSELPHCSPSCGSDQICIRKEINKPAVCQQPPEMAPFKDFTLPFSPKEEVFCTHSFGSGSHSWPNAYYAIDLANGYDKPPAVILAAASGKAFVFLGEDGKLCPEPKGNPNVVAASDCGLSWGNHVKILHEGGYYSFYVHLDHPLVTNGTFVKKGDPIGVEGWTGAAGHRHLHWGVQKLPGKTMVD